MLLNYLLALSLAANPVPTCTHDHDLLCTWLKPMNVTPVTQEVYELALAVAADPVWLKEEEDRLEWTDTLSLIRTSDSEEEKLTFVRAMAITTASSDKLSKFSCDYLHEIGVSLAAQGRLGILRLFAALRCCKMSGRYASIVNGTPDNYQMGQIAVKLYSLFSKVSDALLLPSMVIRKDYRSVVPEVFTGSDDCFTRASKGEDGDVLRKELRGDPSNSDSLIFREWQWAKILRLEKAYSDKPSEENLKALLAHLEAVWKVVGTLGQDPYLWKRALPDLPQIRFILYLQHLPLNYFVTQVNSLFAEAPVLREALWNYYLRLQDPVLWLEQLLNTASSSKIQ